MTNPIFFFIFVFTILVSLKNLTKFIGGIMQKEPKPLDYSNLELISLGLSVSYILTYILYK
jgi:hypothetical protein